MKFILTIILSCMTFLLKAQDVIHLNNRSDTVIYLSQKIAEDPSVSLSTESIIPLYSMQFYRFIYLLSIVTNEEMVDLARNGQNAMRVFAYMSLYQNKYDQLEQIKQLLKNDTTEVIDTQGCISKKTTINKVIMDIKESYWQDEINTFLIQIKNNVDLRKAIFKYIVSSN